MSQVLCSWHLFTGFAIIFIHRLWYQTGTRYLWLLSVQVSVSKKIRKHIIGATLVERYPVMQQRLHSWEKHAARKTITTIIIKTKKCVFYSLGFQCAVTLTSNLLLVSTFTKHTIWNDLNIHSIIQYIAPCDYCAGTAAGVRQYSGHAFLLLTTLVLFSVVTAGNSKSPAPVCTHPSSGKNPRLSIKLWQHTALLQTST